MLEKLIIVDDDTPFRERLGRSMEKKGFLLKPVQVMKTVLKNVLKKVLISQLLIWDSKMVQV